MSKTDGYLYVVPTPLSEDVDDFYTVEQKKCSSYPIFCS